MTIGTHSCKSCSMQAETCSTSKWSHPTSWEKHWSNSIGWSSNACRTKSSPSIVTTSRPRLLITTASRMAKNGPRGFYDSVCIISRCWVWRYSIISDWRSNDETVCRSFDSPRTLESSHPLSEDPRLLCRLLGRIWIRGLNMAIPRGRYYTNHSNQSGSLVIWFEYSSIYLTSPVFQFFLWSNALLSSCIPLSCSLHTLPRS